MRTISAAKRLSLLVVLALLSMAILAACGDNTATPVPATTAAAATTAAGAATTAAAAGGGTVNTTVKGDVTVWGWNVAAKSLQADVEGFNKLYPNVKVTVQDIGRLDVYDKLTTGLAAGGVGLPDVVQVESDHMDVYTSKFPDGFADLTEKATKYEKDFDPSKWAQSKINGKIRSIPWDSGPVGVFYRTDMFQKAGVDATKIETWDDYIEAGKKVVAANPGVKMNTIDYTKDDGLFRMILGQQGGYYFNKDGKITLTSPEAVSAMTVVKKLNDAGLLLNSSGWDGTVAANKNNKVATQIFGVWWSGTIMSEAPEQKGLWDVMPIPALTKGGSRASNLGGSTLAIPAKTKNLDAAWAFVEYSMATKDGQNNIIKNFGIWPSYIPAYSDPFYSANQPYFNNKPIWKMFADQIPQLKAAYYTGDNDKGLSVGADAQAAVLSGTDPAAALQKGADALKQQTGRDILK
ncbi:MAG: sugar ABC transporter substrate-binding protein [Chloroflexi bacterium]|uniref:Sugar ABC transporter substrate-binding protein n=1 Tax=Candidatus Chlorohelix allophototropha TaxID=3003348 RepID=A0A8T7MAE3_9CHLR|nr:sugar ABC transporter substrate-binding protein [Chloroflexota bacterium]WJW68814.1 sugar ABC transporter substrate-binding protein [Chloroflexota bacterium L227-S17]